MFELASQELFNYTVGHFKREEAYLREEGYPDLQRHIVIHQKLTRKVRDLRQRVHDMYRQQQFGDDLVELLSGWLKDHILQEDGKYYRFIQQR